MIKFLEKILGGDSPFSVTITWIDKNDAVGTYDLIEVDQTGIAITAEGGNYGPGGGGAYPMCMPWSSIDWIKVNFHD